MKSPNPLNIISKMWIAHQSESEIDYFVFKCERRYPWVDGLDVNQVSKVERLLAFSTYINPDGTEVLADYIIMPGQFFIGAFEYTNDKPVELTEKELGQKVMFLQLNGIDVTCPGIEKFGELCGLVEEERDNVEHGAVLMAVKLLKERKGIGLKEAKDIVDAYRAWNDARKKLAQLATPDDEDRRKQEAIDEAKKQAIINALIGRR